MYRYIGKRVARIDAVPKVTGMAKYGVDIELPEMLHGKILRSIHPHAKILGIDVSEAKKLQGVKAVITAEDTPKRTYGHIPVWGVPIEDEQMLATDKVRYIGDPVAAVAATSEDTAEEALDLIKVEYEVLPPVFDVDEAVKQDAPRVHDAERNIAFELHRTYGDIDKGFGEADHVYEDKFTTSYVHQCHLEPTVCVASYDAPSDKFTLWITSMDPSYVRITVAKALDTTESKIRIIQPHIGGAFGAKNDMPPLYAVSALLAKKTGRPVRIVNTREEEFTSTRPRVPVVIELKTGVKRDGTLVAMDVKVTADLGAYVGQATGIIAGMCSGPLSLYRCPNIRVDAKAVYTNKIGVGPFRSYGSLQMASAIESQMDTIAEKLSMDPMDLRLKNAVRAGDVSAVGWEVGTCGLGECIQKVAEHTNWREKRANKRPNRGIGMACAILYSDARVFEFGGSVAYVKVFEDGRISVISGETDYGQGGRTTLCQIAAEELGVPVEDVDFLGTDTDVTPYSLGPYGSRVTISGGNAVRLAAMDARRQLFEVAAEMLEARVDDLEIKERGIYVKGTDRSISIAEVARAATIHRRGASGIFGKGVDERPNALPVGDTFNLSSAYSFSAQIAEVEVDSETGKVDVLNLTAACDLGKAINPMGAEGQVEGAVTQSMGFGLTERIEHNEYGGVINPDFLSYMVPTSLDTPPIKVFLVETVDPQGPYGAKSVGEVNIVPTAAALANAVYDAVGVRIKDFPITPVKILRAMG